MVAEDSLLEEKSTPVLILLTQIRYLPVYVHTNFLASPDTATGIITGYVYENPLCWDLGQVPSDFLILFPLEIPATATWVGNKTFNGVYAYSILSLLIF